MAKRFKFRLQKVLEYRKIVKDERRKVLIEKNARLQSLEKEKERILQEMERNELSDGLAVHLVAMYSARLGSELTDLELNLIKAREEQEEALHHYQEAAREEEALVRLKEKKLSEHTSYVLKEEEKFLDELGTQKGNNQYGD